MVQQEKLSFKQADVEKAQDDLLAQRPGTITQEMQRLGQLVQITSPTDLSLFALEVERQAVQKTVRHLRLLLASENRLTESDLLFLEERICDLWQRFRVFSTRSSPLG